MKFQNVGGPDDCSVRTTARVGSSAQRKQDNHDRDQGGNALGLTVPLGLLDAADEVIE